MKVLLLAALLWVAAADDETPVRVAQLRSQSSPPSLRAGPPGFASSYRSYTAPAVPQGVPVHPAPSYKPPRPQPGRQVRYVQRGYASQYQEPRYYDPKPYSFSYGVDDEHNSGAVFSRSEESDGTTTRGQYSVKMPDGCVHTTTFWADKTGYHPTIKIDCYQHRQPTPATSYGYAAPVYRRPSYRDD